MNDGQWAGGGGGGGGGAEEGGGGEEPMTTIAAAETPESVEPRVWRSTRKVGAKPGSAIADERVVESIGSVHLELEDFC